ncbi:MAG: HD domain-containing protein [Anaerolineaceae bacterium]|nr:HD domain-containing protein [Anaerolineaceae bacterium]
MVKVNYIQGNVRKYPSDEYNFDEFTIRTENIRRAYVWGSKLHQGQTRLSGEPYFDCHCVWVASVVDQLVGIESWTIAALLHDAIEDQETSLDEIRQMFPGELGEEVATIVDGMTKLVISRGGRSRELETLRKIASFRNPAVFLIKLADRTHNILTLDFMPPQKQEQKAEEAIRAYSRLAGILNCYLWRCWLEDISFPFYQPATYQIVKEKIDQDPRLQPAFINSMMDKLAEIMERFQICGEIKAVPNGYWRSWLKLKQLARMRKASLDSFIMVEDLISFRMILDTEDSIDCYRLLSGVNRFLGSCLDQTGFNDYIAVSQNGYQALQVTGFFENIGAIEVAIMTKEMEGENMWGIVDSLKHGRPISQYQPVTILTPTGGLRFVEEGATVLDAIASIQQDYFLDKVTTVEVNGTLAHLSDRVRPGDVIEVITGDRRLVPDESWLNFATRSTVPLLRSVLANQALKEEAVLGRQLLRGIIAARGIIDLEDVQALEPEKMDQLLGLLASPNLDDLYAAVGGGAINLDDFAEQMDNVGLSKKDLRWTTMHLIGSSQANRPGVLAHLTGLISQSQSNILRVVNNTYPDDSYEIRIVTDEMTPEQESLIKEAMKDLAQDIQLEITELA